MGITDFFSDLMASMGFEEAHAEAPEKDEEEKDEGGDDKEEKDKGGDDKGDDKEEKEDGGDDEKEEGEEGEGEEEEEEEDDEPVDPKPALEQECAKSAQCRGYKHHYDECVERVTEAAENEDHPDHKLNENCVEEFFHLQHCATACAAPKLFRQLK